MKMKETANIMTGQELKDSNPTAFKKLKRNFNNCLNRANKQGLPCIKASEGKKIMLGNIEVMTSPQDRSIKIQKFMLELEFPKYCPILGHKINYNYDTPRKIGGDYDAPSFDKIDPRLGYVEGNVRVVSFQGNQVLGNVLEHLATNKHFFQFMEKEMERLKN